MSEAEEYPVLIAPSGGVPRVVDTPEALADSRARLAEASAPVAIDTERAHGYRYTAKAYLIQIRREDAGTHLIDPIPFEDGRPRADFAELAEDLAEAVWILHAAAQDLPCLAEVNLLPRKLFDTELAARLLGLPRVNLSALMETALGVTLLKEHSAADWSTRPIPADWLTYAALDVEALSDLRSWLIERLEAEGKLDWAEQEFTHLVEHAADPPPVRRDPWRRTAGIHNLRSGRALALVRELWQAREQIAAAEDRAPGRVLSDRAITALAAKLDGGHQDRLGPSDLRSVHDFRRPRQAAYEPTWLAALERAAELSPAELPARHVPPEGPPQPKSWERRWPDSFARYQRIRPALIKLAEELGMPVENLITPDHLRRLLWDSPATTDAASVESKLGALGARPWQRDLVVPRITALW